MSSDLLALTRTHEDEGVHDGDVKKLGSILPVITANISQQLGSVRLYLVILVAIE